MWIYMTLSVLFSYCACRFCFVLFLFFLLLIESNPRGYLLTYTSSLLCPYLYPYTCIVLHYGHLEFVFFTVVWWCAHNLLYLRTRKLYKNGKGRGSFGSFGVPNLFYEINENVEYIPINTSYYFVLGMFFSSFSLSLILDS